MKVMIIGVLKEIKNNENRVGMTPGGAKAYIRKGHTVLVETQAGEGSGFRDEEYKEAGCQICDKAHKIYQDAEMLIKVKEPLPEEYDLLQKDQILYAYLHLAPAAELTHALLKAKIKGVAYETVQLENGSLPLLTPMSEVAGRMSVQIGAGLLQKISGGRGILLGGVPGVAPGEVTIVGGGNVGINAAKIAVGLGAKVTILDMNAARLSYLDDIFNGRVITLASNEYNLEEAIEKTDLLIGAILTPGRVTAKIVTDSMVKRMKKGAVIVDVAIDQGGCIETSELVTSHDKPTYIRHGVVHYSVPNIPGAVPRTSTIALEAATLPYGLMLAEKGLERAVMENKALMRGLNIYDGNITHEAVSESLKMPFVKAGMLIPQWG